MPPHVAALLLTCSRLTHLDVADICIHCEMQRGEKEAGAAAIPRMHSSPRLPTMVAFSHAVVRVRRETPVYLVSSEPSGKSLPNVCSS